MSKVVKVTASIRELIAHQQEQRKLLVQLILAILNKEEGPMTIHEWTKRKAEVLWDAGLGPEPDHIRRKRVWDERKKLN